MENVFKIIAREESVKTDNLKGLLAPFGDVEVVLDVVGDIKGLTGMTGRWRNKTTAWDTLFKDLEEEYTWVIEDDIAFNKDTISAIFNCFKSDKSDLITNWVLPRKKDPNWGWWHLTNAFKDICPSKSWISLNCICRISPTLIRRVKDFVSKHGKGLFHEILLPTLSDTRVDFRSIDKFKGFFEVNNFNWSQPAVNLDKIQGNKIYHPVKSDSKHTQICNYG